MDFFACCNFSFKQVCLILKFGKFKLTQLLVVSVLVSRRKKSIIAMEVAELVPVELKHPVSP